MMQCKDAIHSLDPWELRHATNLGSCSGLRDATGGIAGGGGLMVEMSFIFLFGVPFSCPGYMCLFVFFSFSSFKIL